MAQVSRVPNSTTAPLGMRAFYAQRMQRRKLTRPRTATMDDGDGGVSDVS